MNGIVSIILSLVVTLILFTVARFKSSEITNLWLLLAKISGLLGSVLIAWNFLIATKNILIEKLFNGLDKAYKIHNIIGNIAFILIINHPIFLIINSLPFNASKNYLVPSFLNLSYFFGIIALYVLIILVILTIFIDLPYKFWKKTHEYMGFVIIFASLHSLLITSDVSVYIPLKIWVLSWNLIAICAFLYKRYFYYLISNKNNYFVKNILQDSNYLILTLAPLDSNKTINFKAGQFAFFSLAKDLRDDHPFTVLEQNSNEIKIGARIIGNFTNILSKLAINSKINVIGPFGSFANNLFKPNQMIWISGGIGITPFLSMIKLLRKDQSVTMIYSTRSYESKLFSNMFLKYTKLLPNFKFIIHYSDILGRLNEENIAKYATLNKTVYVYLCGPKLMMEYLSHNLPNKGILQKNIIYEDFILKP